MSGYSEAGASQKRRSMKGFVPNSSSAREDIDFNNGTLRQRARMLYMNAPVATGAINTNRTKIVGTGLVLKSTVDKDVLGLTPEQAKEWQLRCEAEFALWSSKKENCDALGMNTFNGLQQLALKSWLMSGDVFAVIKRYNATPQNPYTLRIHLIEADRVSTPHSSGLLNPLEYKIPKGKPGAGHKVFDGAEVDDNGRVVAYHVCNRYPNETTFKDMKWTRVEVVGKKTGLPNILHVMDAERPEQYRGVPYLAQVIEPLLQLRRYTESELTAALIQSFFTAWIVTETNPDLIPINEVGAGEFDDGNPPANMSNNENEYEMGPGTVIHLKDGEKITFGSPTIPAAGFDVFVKEICKQVGTALEIPYDVLMKEFNSSYSASRGALLEAWEALKMRRGWFVEDFCQPIYEIWLAEAVAIGRIKAPGFFDDPLIRNAWCGARWIGPVQGQLDPKKEAEAALLLAQNGIKTYSQITTELGGGDWKENAEELKADQEYFSNNNSNNSSEKQEATEDDEDGEDDNQQSGVQDGSGE